MYTASWKLSMDVIGLEFIQCNFKYSNVLKQLTEAYAIYNFFLYLVNLFSKNLLWISENISENIFSNLYLTVRELLDNLQNYIQYNLQIRIGRTLVHYIAITCYHMQ